MTGAALRAPLVRAIAPLLLSLGLVILIAIAQRRFWVAPFDKSIVLTMGQWRGSAIGQQMTAIMIAASVVGDTAARIIMTTVVSIALIWRARKYLALWLVATVVGGVLLNLALKQIFAAPRPTLLPHFDPVTSYSFPSGHAAGNMIFFGALALLLARRWGWIAAAFVIALIGISRVWLGVHWPTDVLAGWVEGIGWLLCCGTYLRR